MTVAHEILAQLGGNKFLAMTGAKNLIDGGNYLTMTLPRAANGIKYVRVTLNSMDLYDVEFFKMKKKEFETVTIALEENVYGDMLQKTFTEHTQLHTKLF